MFMLKSTHNTVVQELNDVYRADIIELNLRIAAQVRSIAALDRIAAAYCRERDAALAELAPLKAARETRLAQLSAANERRRAEAQKVRA